MPIQNEHLQWLYVIAAIILALLATFPREGKSTGGKIVRNTAWLAALVPTGWLLLNLPHLPREGTYLIPIYYGAAWIIVGFFFVFVLSIDPVAAQICGNCGYDMRGNPRGACPECGHTNAPPDSSRNDL